MTPCWARSRVSTQGTSGRRWIIDPVDGTKLYAEGIPLWTTLIALEIDAHVVLGIADAPAIGDRYVGVLGPGRVARFAAGCASRRSSRLQDAFVPIPAVEEWIAGGT